MRLSPRYRLRPGEIGFTLNEVLISIVILTIALLGLAGAMSYGMTSGQHGSNITEALGYARQIEEYCRSNNSPFTLGTPTTLPPATSGINDPIGTYEALNAAPFTSTSGLNLPANSRYQRSIQCQFSNLSSEDTTSATYAWKTNVRQISVTIGWFENSARRTIQVSAFVNQ